MVSLVGFYIAGRAHFNDFPNRNLALLGIAVGIVCSTIGLVGRFKTTRVALSTSTSRIRSAAQGFVELSGRAISVDKLLLTPYSSTRAAWFRYVIEEKQGFGKKSAWVTVHESSSEAPIALDDGSDLCFLNPNQFEVSNLRCLEFDEEKSWVLGFQRRHKEYLIADGMLLYALGEFKTCAGSNSTGHFFLSMDGGLFWSKSEFQEGIQKFFDRVSTEKPGSIHLLLGSKDLQKSILSCGTQDEFIKSERGGMLLSSSLLLLGLSALAYI